MLRLLIKKTAPKANVLFNSCCPEVLRIPESFGYWFNDKPIKQRTFVNYLPDICEASGCRTICTAHCLRATAITAMNDSGYEARYILFMSGHHNEDT